MSLPLALAFFAGVLVLVGGLLPHVSISASGESVGSNFVHEDWRTGASIAFGIGVLLLAAVWAAQPHHSGVPALLAGVSGLAVLVGLIDWHDLHGKVAALNGLFHGFGLDALPGGAPTAHVGSGVYVVILGGLLGAGAGIADLLRR